MKLEKAQKDLLYLLLKQDASIPLETIQDELNVGRRTVYYCVNKLNEVLFEVGISPVNNKRGEGYYLTKQQKEKIKEVISRLKKGYNILFVG